MLTGSKAQLTDQRAAQTSRRETSLSYLTLFATTGTLVCCALPILLVSLGLGAAVAGMTSAFPGLIVLSKYKLWVFAGSGLLLAVTAWSIWRPGRVCPADPLLAANCQKADRLSRRAFWSATTIWCIGFFAAYLALPIRIKLGI